MMPEDKSGWNIAPPAINSYLAKMNEINLIEDGNFSILSNARREQNEIAEIASALGETYIAPLVTFKPQRLALFETVAIIETEVKIRQEEDLAPIVQTIYRDAVVPIIKAKADQLLADTDLEVSTAVKDSVARFKAGKTDLTNPYDRLVKETYDKVSEREKKGLYKPGEYAFTATIDSVVEAAVFDKMYTKVMEEKVAKLVEPAVQKAINNQSVTYPVHNDQGQVVGTKPLERLSLHQGNERHTFMLAGPPACGKGSCIGMFEVDASKLGIEWSDVVKINTDTHRNIVSHPEALGENKTYHAALNNDEAFIITTKANMRLQQKIQSGRAPHTLIDAVYPSQERVDIGTVNNGQLHIKVVTAPVEISIERANKRGQETNRFVPSSYLLGSHKSVSNDLHTILTKNKGKSIEYELYDTNVPRGKHPILIEAGNLREHQKTKPRINVYDLERSTSFYAKKGLNPNATTAEELKIPPIETKNGILLATHLVQMQNSGITVKFDKHVDQCKFDDAHHSLSKQLKTQTGRGG